MTRRLQLSTERLTELTNDDLVAVVGGVDIVLTGTETVRCPTVPVAQCVVVPPVNVPKTKTRVSCYCNP